VGGGGGKGAGGGGGGGGGGLAARFAISSVERRVEDRRKRGEGGKLPRTPLGSGEFKHGRLQA